MNDLAANLITRLGEKSWMLTTAESCTGGAISAAITSISGASAVFDRGFITYSNNAKMDMLGVNEETLKTHGAVSPQTATEMAQGALKNSKADIAISVTGIAGPDGGTDEKPVGLVYFGLAVKGKESQSFKHIFSGSRTDIQHQAVKTALDIALNTIT